MICSHTPKAVKVGNKKVYLCGYNDLTLKTVTAISDLDMFIALSTVWEEHLPRVYANPLFQELYTKLGMKKTIPNLLVIPVEDQKTYEPLVKEVLLLLKRGMKIGFGCHGGHGRTGWLYARLLQEVEGLQGDSLVREVRRRWCHEAIESKAQFTSLGVDWAGYIEEFSYSTFGRDIGSLNGEDMLR